MGLNQQQEAVLFLIKNRESSKPNPLDEYKVGLTAGLPLFVDTDAVLKKHDLEIGTTSVNSVGAVAGILRITDDFGPEILDRTLTVAEAAWGRTAQTWDGMLLGGIGMFLGRHGEDIKDADLARKIQKAGHGRPVGEPRPHPHHHRRDAQQRHRQPGQHVLPAGQAGVE